jgi:hypothetical protein
MRDEIIKLKQDGLSIREIAIALGYSEYKVKYHLYPNIKTKQLENNKSLRDERKDKIIDYLGGRCKVCGYSRCKAALDLHHLDPNSKLEKLRTRSGGSIFGRLSKWEDLKAEADKCVLLCCRCHREVHAGLIAPS